MAALSDRHLGTLVELRRVSAEHLGPLLIEEEAVWRNELDWDFRPSADLVRRFVGIHALSGFALMRDAEIIGYCYYVCEENKGLIGDLYVKRGHASAANESVLLHAVIEALWHTPGVRRVEAQIMMLTSAGSGAAPHPESFRSYPRYFLSARLGSVRKLPARELSGIAIAPWRENRQDETARLIAASYQGHVDSLVNDQYRSSPGASRFLTNIVQYPGCGAFFAPASYAATETGTGALCGISLASLVAADAGHITQVCVSPAHRGTGLGYELVRRSMLALAAHGCRSASLTVTTANQDALRLYERMGFERRRTFSAYVWEIR